MLRGVDGKISNRSPTEPRKGWVYIRSEADRQGQAAASSRQTGGMGGPLGHAVQRGKVQGDAPWIKEPSPVASRHEYTMIRVVLATINEEKDLRMDHHDQ